MSNSKVLPTHQKGKFGMNFFLELYALKDASGNVAIHDVHIDDIDLDSSCNYRY